VLESVSRQETVSCLEFWNTEGGVVKDGLDGEVGLDLVRHWGAIEWL